MTNPAARNTRYRSLIVTTAGPIAICPGMIKRSPNGVRIVNESVSISPITRRTAIGTRSVRRQASPRSVSISQSDIYILPSNSLRRATRSKIHQVMPKQLTVISILYLVNYMNLLSIPLRTVEKIRPVIDSDVRTAVFDGESPEDTDTDIVNLEMLDASLERRSWVRSERRCTTSSPNWIPLIR